MQCETGVFGDGSVDRDVAVPSECRQHRPQLRHRGEMLADAPTRADTEREEGARGGGFVGPVPGGIEAERLAPEARMAIYAAAR